MAHSIIDFAHHWVDKCDTEMKEIVTSLFADSTASNIRQAAIQIDRIWDNTLETGPKNIGGFCGQMTDKFIHISALIPAEDTRQDALLGLIVALKELVPEDDPDRPPWRYIFDGAPPGLLYQAYQSQSWHDGMQVLQCLAYAIM